MDLYTDEIQTRLCKWCNLNKTITRSKYFSHRQLVAQIEGGICFDCYRLSNKDEIICDECIKIINKNHPFSHEYTGYINILTDYDFHGTFSFCRKCLSDRGYTPNIEHIIQHHKHKYINEILDNFNGMK